VVGKGSKETEWGPEEDPEFKIERYDSSRVILLPWLPRGGPYIISFHEEVN